MLEGVYNISCKYVSGYNHTGCEYLLAGSDGVVISGTIMGENYNVIIVYEVDNILVQNGSFDASKDVTFCTSTTG